MKTFVCDDNNPDIETAVCSFDFAGAVKSTVGHSSRYIRLDGFDRKEVLLFSEYKVIYSLTIGRIDRVTIAGAVRRSSANSDEMKTIFEKYG